MEKTDRRKARDAWKERKADWAIMAVRIGDGVWLKLVSDPAAFERRMGFTMRTGSAPLPDMAEAYRAAGTVEIEVVERLDPELSDMARDTEAEARMAHWKEELEAKVF